MPPNRHRVTFTQDPDSKTWMYKCSCGKKHEDLPSRGAAVQAFGKHMAQVK